MKTATYRETTNKLLAKRLVAEEILKREKKALEAAELRLKAVEQAIQIIQQIAQEIQQQAHARISSVVTRCLETVFSDEAYTFKIVVEQKRNKTEARCVFVRSDGLEVDPMTAAGGGVVDVAGFALRLACLALSKPPLRRLLVLDEPFRFVSAEYRPAVRQILEVLSKELETQIVMVTHVDALRTGTVVEIGGE